MPALYLTENDVRELLDMETAISTLEAMFRELGAGKAVNVPRTRAQIPGFILHSMTAAAEYLGVAGWKVYSSTPSGSRFLVGLYSTADGRLLALIEADHLGRLRTGAASGVATECMARGDSRVVGVLGTGSQARTQLKAVCTVRKIEAVEVYSRDEGRRLKFCEEMSEWCNTKVVPVHSPDEAAAEKDIVICATSSRTPVIDGRVLDEGTHVNAVGSNFLNKAEIDATTVKRADVIVCDSIAQCKLEAGDFVEPLAEGVTDWPLLHELADVVSDRVTGRHSPEDITLFKSVGLAIEDVALGYEALRRALREGLGQTLPF